MDISITVITLIGGGILGFLTSLYLERNKNMIGFNLRIFEKYDGIVHEIIEILTEMSSLNLEITPYSDEKIENWQKEISRLYYKYYLYLPQNVLLELNCLHSCLKKKGRIWYIVEKKHSNKIRKIISDDDINELAIIIEDTTLVSVNTSSKKDKNHDIKYLIRKYGNRIPASIKINYQARRVIISIDKHWGHRNLFNWTKQLKKRTLFENQTNNEQKRNFRKKNIHTESLSQNR